MKKPLNGLKTHPMSATARASLRMVSRAPVPRSEINAGVVDRLSREDLIEFVELPSPFKTHKGRLIQHVQITDAGLKVLNG